MLKNSGLFLEFRLHLQSQYFCNQFPKNDRYFKTTNELIIPDERDSVDNYYYEYATGLKTGYTEAAKDCIVASAKKDDKEFIAVILGAERTENGLSGRFIDCKNLFNYAFENYKTHTINKENTILKQVKVSKASIFNNDLDVVIKDGITLVVKEDTNISNITPTVEITSDLTAPISKNSVIGTITYNVDGNTYTSDLLAGSDIVESNAFNTFLSILSVILVLYFLYKLLNWDNKKKKKKRKKSSKKGKRTKSKRKTTKDRDDFLYW